MTTLRAAFRGFPLLFCLFGLLPASAQQPGAGGPRLAFLPRTTVIAAGEQSGDDGYGDGNLATQAGLTNPSGIAVDSAGNLFIATAGDNTVRRVDAVTGIISTVAGISPGSGGLGPGPGPGSGEHRPRGAGAPATTVALNHPTSVVVDAAGDLYIASSFDGVVYEVDTSGNLTTYAGTLNSSGYSGDGAAATAAQLYSPTGLSLDASETSSSRTP